MSFSKEWDEVYKKNRHMSVWPWSDLVSFVYRYVYRNKKIKVLELGCGAGANIPFFLSLNSNYYAIEGSEHVVNMLRKKYPKLKRRIIHGDFTKSFKGLAGFDLVIDRGSLTCNDRNSVLNCINLIERALKSKGYFISIDWFSTTHSDFNSKAKSLDKYTKTNFKTRQFKNIGKIHFVDKTLIKSYFKEFKITVLEHKIIKNEIPNKGKIFAAYNFVAQKT